MTGKEIVPKKLGARPVFKGELSPAARKGAALYACGATSGVVAKECGVTVATAYRWRQDTRVQREIDKLVREIQQATVRQARAVLPQVITALSDIALDPTQHAPARIQAGKVLLDKFPFLSSDAFETLEARQAARSEAPKVVVETDIQAVMAMMLEIEQVNVDNALRAQKMVRGEVVSDAEDWTGDDWTTPGSSEDKTIRGEMVE